VILPSKKLPPENSLIFIGGSVLDLLTESKTVSRLWEDFKQNRIKLLSAESCDVSFDWFVLALDFLHLIGSVKLVSGRLVKSS
jgi:hypothetical protein